MSVVLFRRLVLAVLAFVAASLLASPLRAAVVYLSGMPSAPSNIGISSMGGSPYNPYYLQVNATCSGNWNFMSPHSIDGCSGTTTAPSGNWVPKGTASGYSGHSQSMICTFTVANFGYGHFWWVGYNSSEYNNVSHITMNPPSLSNELGAYTTQ